MTYLTAEEWSVFDRLFDKREGTSYYDTRQLALDLIKKDELRQALIDDKATITTILMMANEERQL